MKKIIVIIITVFSLSILCVSCKNEAKEVKKEQKAEDTTAIAAKEVYQCPMDCEKGKTYKKEGSCPVCEMKLRKKKTEEKNHDDEHH